MTEREIKVECLKLALQYAGYGAIETVDDTYQRHVDFVAGDPLRLELLKMARAKSADLNEVEARVGRYLDLIGAAGVRPDSSGPGTSPA